MQLLKINDIEVCRSEKHPNYGASRDGRVFRLSTKREMTKTFNKDTGYNYVRLCHNNHATTVRVNQVIGYSWLLCDKEKHHTMLNHIDGNKLNDAVDNLEWCTASQNQRHAVETGLKGRGDKLYNSELTDQKVHTICKRLEEGYKVNELANEFEVSKDIIRKIRAGDTYFHVRQLYTNIPHRYQSEYAETTVRWVCEQILRGEGDKGIVEKSKNSTLTIIDIKRIRYKIRYNVISDEYF